MLMLVVGLVKRFDLSWVGQVGVGSLVLDGWSDHLSESSSWHGLDLSQVASRRGCIQNIQIIVNRHWSSVVVWN